MQERLITVVFLVLLSNLVNAASFGTYRIYLDSDNSQDKFIVKNNTVFPEQCKVSFSYVLYKENGEVIKLTESEQNKLSKAAVDRFRFSPRQFTIQPKSFQYVTFKYRRQINDSTAEHRTYVNYRCIPVKDKPQQTGVNLSPLIAHSIPLVLRTAPLNKMTLQLSFSNIQKLDKSVSFRLQHSGNRSFVGDILLMTEDGQELQTLQRNFAFYPEMKYKDLTFSLGAHHNIKVKIIFQESSLYGGNATFELNLQGDK
jgi:P pilus assembly chaperone PapD